MQFYSGFSLKDEEYLFEEYINKSQYCVCGFSYGATKALRYTQEQLKMGRRIDTLQFFSPAFFQTKSYKFKKLQTIGYKKDKSKYLNSFIDLCFKPYEKKITEHYETEIGELEELLNYRWDIQELKELVNKGVKLEIYLGGKDKIIDGECAREFFLHVATVTYIKDANHFLQVN